MGFLAPAVPALKGIGALASGVGSLAAAGKQEVPVNMPPPIQRPDIPAPSGQPPLATPVQLTQPQIGIPQLPATQPPNLLELLQAFSERRF